MFACTTMQTNKIGMQIADEKDATQKKTQAYYLLADDTSCHTRSRSLHCTESLGLRATDAKQVSFFF